MPTAQPTVDFRDLLSKRMDTAVPPPPLPAGTYLGTVASHEYQTSSKKKTPFVRFHLGVSGAGEDVDPESLQGIDLAGKQLRMDFYLTDDARYRLRDFLESCGISVEGKTDGECIPQANGQAVQMTVTQRPDDRDPSGKKMFNDVTNLRGAQ